MSTPNSPYDDLENAMPEWHEPFPEPQTIPSGWDLSELHSLSKLTMVDDSDVKIEGSL